VKQSESNSKNPNVHHKGIGLDDVQAENMGRYDDEDW
jgi:hypothetical protein